MFSECSYFSVFVCLVGVFAALQLGSDAKKIQQVACLSCMGFCVAACLRCVGGE